MHPHLRGFLEAFILVATWELLLGFLFQIIPHVSMKLANFCAHAPLLDLLVASISWIPWLWACLFAGWAGLAGAILAQMFALYLWCFLHENIFNRQAASGPRIVKFINRTVGRWQNHLALWVTLIALPGFWLIRLMEFLAYEPLILLLNFPRYKQSEWINISRQKFTGLIGHDLVWCLYCDWMTGVYSLGAEMLRNVESFWCPIRFYDGKKCDNCKLDFPDIANGWTRPDGTMADVVTTLESHYADGHREWFGHPARLTVRGQSIETVKISATDK
jgi:hypothetical protein